MTAPENVSSDLGRAEIVERRGRLGEGLWLCRDVLIRELAWVDGEWVAYDTRGGGYRQSLFPDGLRASLYQPVGVEDDPRLAERVPWPPVGPAGAASAHDRPVPFLRLVGLGAVAALTFALAVQVRFHALAGRPVVPALAGRFGPTDAYVALLAGIGLVLGAVGFVGALAAGAPRVGCRCLRRESRSRQAGVRR